MKDLTENIKNATTDLYHYVDQKVELTGLQVSEKIIDSVSSMVAWLVIGFLASMFILLLTIAGIISLSIWLDSYLYGTLIGSSIFFILSIVVFKLKSKLIINKVRNSLYGELLEKYKNDEK